MRRRWAIVAVVVVLVAAVLVGGSLWLRRDTSRPVTVDDARDRLTTTSSGATTSVPPKGAARPKPGVYDYRGSGTESLSLPPLSQRQGPTIPATVELVGDDCWTIRFDYSTNHWETWDYCRRGTDLVETGGKTWQRWMIGATAITNLATSVCDDAMVLPSERTKGDEWPARCVGTNETIDGEAISKGPYTYLGEQELKVGDTTVTAAHFVRDRTMTGAQQGSERSDVWFDVRTGLPIRNERKISVDTDTPVGSSTYTEEGEFHLVSPDPTG